MAHMDIFKGNHFSMVSMLAAIDNVDYKPNRLQSMSLTEVKSIRTKGVSIEMRKGGTGLIQTSARGAPLDRAEKSKRNIRTFQTTRIGTSDTMYADEIQDIRAFGSESELMQTQKEVADRMQKINDKIELTEEHMLMGMVQGIVVDADGSDIYNWFDEMDVVPNVDVGFDFQNATLAQLRQKCRDITRGMKRNAKGAVFSGAHALCSDEFYDALVTHAEIEKTYLNQVEAKSLRLGDEGKVFDTFRFEGVTFENYQGTDDNSTVAIKSGQCSIFPSNSRGVFVEALAPGESFDVVNQPGRKRYAQIIRDTQRNEWVKVEVKTYPLHVCQRPQMLYKGKVAA